MDDNNVARPVGVVLLRHGESTWNLDNRFTGWVDVPLTPRGEQQARALGVRLASYGLSFDKVYVSYLQRTARTAELVMSVIEPGWDISRAVRSWRLNERMYGALTGHDKRAVAEAHSADAFQRIIYDPPPLEPASAFYPGNEPLYADLPREAIPLKESFDDVRRRIAPVWDKQIRADAERGERVLVISSKNALRALLMHIADVPADALPSVDVPNSVPFSYDLRSRTIHALDGEGGGLSRSLSPHELSSFSAARSLPGMARSAAGVVGAGVAGAQMTSSFHGTD